tara:strand:+ start:404 stop:1006 length:603 start_codon:yes stop_codon:yes gene_type:complete
MKFADNGGGNFEQPPAGTHMARCIKVIDLGTQKGEYQGKATSKRQCIIGFELPEELMTEGDYAGQPFVTSRFYTVSLGEKANLRKDLENWRGRAFTKEELGGFESKNILGKPCMLSLTPSDKGKVRITGIMASPKGSKLPPAINELVYFSLDEFDAGVFERLSEGIKKMVVQSPEYKIATTQGNENAKGSFDEMDGDIPF